MSRWLWALGLLLLIPTAVFAQDAAVATPTLAPAPAPAQDEIIVHTVIAGQTLYTIANLYGVTVDDLLLLNNLTTESLLAIGQELVISGIVPLALGVEAVSDSALLNVPGLPPVPKIHQVQAGDTIVGLAERYGLSVDELQLVNGFNADTLLTLGMTVFIPNQTGDLFERNYAVQAGDTLDFIAAQFNTSADLIVEQSRLVNPDYLIAGQQIRLVSRTGSAESVPVFGRTHIVQTGDTLTTIAAQHNQPPQAIAHANGIPYPGPITAGQQLHIPGSAPLQPFPIGVDALTLSTLPLRQGETFSVYIEPSDGLTPTGEIRFTGLISPTQPWFNVDYAQSFDFYEHANGYVALVGIDAFAQPGLYTLELFGGDAATPIVSQPLLLEGINFGFQSIPVADDVSLRATEDAVLAAVYATSSAESSWTLTQTFAAPLDNTAYRSAGYGAPRSYAGAPVRIFHTGVDYAAPVNTPIKAIAPGTVVYSDFTQLRGNVVVLDHGWGIMSGYFHMEIRTASVGDQVSTGQVIGALGNTGLSTGAHLHWDMRVQGVPVNGLQWLAEPMPNFTSPNP